MNFLEEKIAKDATVLNNDVLKVDNFINQQIDCNLMKKIAKDFANHFKDKKMIYGEIKQLTEGYRARNLHCTTFTILFTLKCLRLCILCT